MAKEQGVAEACKGCGTGMMGCGCIICLLPIIGVLLAALAAAIGAAGS